MAEAEVREYDYIDGKIVEERGNEETLRYTYDDKGNLTKISHIQGTTTTDYYVATNSRGDIEQIYNSNGTLQCRYIYDAWGNIEKIVDSNYNEITSETNIGHINPIRYRGYYYDKETNLYYLNSRYYDPEVSRFINADEASIASLDPSSLYDKNLYAYCDNNPIIYKDTDGYTPDLAFDIAFIIGDIASIISNPKNILGYAELAGDLVGFFLPGITGGGTVVRTIINSDKLGDAAKLADKVLDSKKTITSSIDLGKEMHKVYNPLNKNMYDAIDDYLLGKSLKRYNSRLIPDAVDFDNRIIYELKPYNRNSYYKALKQTKRYANVLGGEWTIVIDLYRK